MSDNLKLSLAISALAVLISCGGSGYGGGGSYTPAPSSTAQHLYVSDYGVGGLTRVYKLPISAASIPVASMSFPDCISVAVDASGNLIAGDNSVNLKFFQAPLSNSSVASATFLNGSGTGNFQAAFSPSGKLFTASQNASIEVFTPPFSNSSAPTGQVTDPNISIIFGVAVDPSGSLFVSGLTKVDVLPNEGATAATAKVTFPAGAAVRHIARDSSHFFAANPGPGGAGNLLVYALPLTDTSLPSATITSGINNPAGVAVDASGYLYVSNLGDSTISVYAPPFSDTSAPVTTLTISSASLFGIAIGK